MQLVIDFLTSPAVLAVLATFGVAILDALVAAFRDSHPLIARLLMFIADAIRNKTGTRPPLSMLAALVAVLVLTDAATAGPILDRIRARRAQQCQSCQPAPSYQFAPPQGRPCFNCTSCENNCSCQGGGYYCPRVCPVEPQTLWQSGPAVLGPRPQTFGPIVIPQGSFQSCPSCQGGNCQIPSSRRR